ncbi:MAG: hypothetical protein HOL85_16245 [Rhodospirillaceae bacterium]|jgi:hypothetical protein|nr:hypothetical protein [Rhodospirillaceae bacterium]MBT6136941.1 hypothetical protein [Rhodospirillaceae bacterium]
MDERKKLKQMLREARARISPEVMEKARRAAYEEIGVPAPEPENEASRLFKMALDGGGRKREQVLAYIERKLSNKRLN